MRLLQKMGWKPGQVLGKRGEGNLEPIAMSVKMDRKGLISCEESGKGGKGGKGGPRNVAVTPGVQGELFFDKIRIILIVKKIIYLREYISLAELLDLLFNPTFPILTCVDVRFSTQVRRRVLKLWKLRLTDFLIFILAKQLF